jgi:hypothetical protein
MKAAETRSVLREKADRETVEALLIQTYFAFWGR